MVRIDPKETICVAHDPPRSRVVALAAGAIALTAGSVVTADAQALLVEDFESRWPEAAAVQQAPAAEQASPAATQQNPPTAEKGAAPPAGAPPPPAGPAVAGTWSGKVTQLGKQTAYAVVVTITAKGGETDYPDQGCGGKLTRIGASRSYAFFIETITRGQVNKGGHCLDGTITVARVGENLGWEWFGIAQGDVVVAWGMLTRNPAQKQSDRQ
jgi:hypothetical protein